MEDVIYCVYECRLKEIREKHGLTQTELGDLVGISKNSISSIERNEYCPTLRTAISIALTLKTPLFEIFSLRSEDGQILFQY